MLIYHGPIKHKSVSFTDNKKTAMDPSRFKPMIFSALSFSLSLINIGQGVSSMAFIYRITN